MHNFISFGAGSNYNSVNANILRKSMRKINRVATANLTDFGTKFFGQLQAVFIQVDS